MLCDKYEDIDVDKFTKLSDATYKYFVVQIGKCMAFNKKSYNNKIDKSYYKLILDVYIKIIPLDVYMKKWKLIIDDNILIFMTKNIELECYKCNYDDNHIYINYHTYITFHDENYLKLLYIGKHKNMIDHNNDKNLLGLLFEYIDPHDYDENEYYIMTKIALKQNGCALKYVKNITFELCKIALEENGLALEYINRQDVEYDYEELCMIAIDNQPLALKFIEEQTYEICMKAVKKNGNAILYAKYQYEDLCYEAINSNANAFQYIINKNYDISMKSVEKCGSNIKYIDDEIITTDMCMMAIKNEYKCLRCIKEEYQTYDICLEAVKQHGGMLKYVKNKTYNICLEAVKNYGNAYEYVNDEYLTDELIDIAINNIIYFDHIKLKKLLNHPTLGGDHFKYNEIIEKILDNDIYALYYYENISQELIIKCIIKKYNNGLMHVVNQTYDMCMESVKKDGITLKYVKNQTIDICIEAIKQNINAIYFVKFPENDLPYIPNYMQDCANDIKKCTLHTQKILNVYINEAKKSKSDDHIEYTLYLILCKYNPFDIQTFDRLKIVKKEFFDFANILYNDSANLFYIKDRDREMCKNAMLSNSHVIVFMNENELDDELCYLAIKCDSSSIILIIDINFINNYFE
jgi:hypothetical protein